MDIGPVSTVRPPAQTTCKLIDILKVISSGLASIPYHDLSVLVYETNCGSWVFHIFRSSSESWNDGCAA